MINKPVDVTFEVCEEKTLVETENKGLVGNEGIGRRFRWMGIRGQKLEQIVMVVRVAVDRFRITEAKEQQLVLTSAVAISSVLSTPL